MPAWLEVEGCQTRVARRRYPRKVMTYVEARIRDEWVSLGDPWPMAQPPEDEVAEEIRARQ